MWEAEGMSSGVFSTESRVEAMARLFSGPEKPSIQRVKPRF